jgi:hypothetical protein
LNVLKGNLQVRKVLEVLDTIIFGGQRLIGIFGVSFYLIFGNSFLTYTKVKSGAFYGS